ncbi:UDP-N-acetylglucosamine 1-carboxyvinyltransferase [Alicyclobacillus fastidiosus]|uniref:UDP-N-acetylglucosamine 1-carboxyvinyltransferase n=1 Tax=Alicyclobacillus fastidiosus TaxID=392011 RepID=A0ABY6ZCH0_9BACL|nr:UDP-N-acetylglucosamine 1-carboxyvinyltransferase [Alicyclobacillus fastidiosus]WAH40435.1 UDP-N-acetylglucosamine 1-carboxyvinyltransferase [Alicyclobacillus fastidiosus]
MDLLRIQGGVPIRGETRVYGAKNAALPILAATVMAAGTSVIEDVPNLEDVRVMMQILEQLGARVRWYSTTSVEVDASSIHSTNVPADLMQRMRSSIFLMGPLLARFGDVTLSKPGGCVIGQRPIDYHLHGMRQLGAKIEERHGYIRCSARRLVGTSITLDFPSVGATENLMMAAALADGVTVIENAAREPEVEDLAQFLMASGAAIDGAGSDTVVIHGCSHLHDTTYQIIPDRIVTGTLLLAAAATRGEVTVLGARLNHLGAIVQKLRDTGVRVDVDRDIITVKCDETPQAVDFRTAPFPGFPTDLQAPFMALLTTSSGTSVIHESVFEARFKHVDELKRMGADIAVDMRTAVVRGVPTLSGARVTASDLRGGAALLVAALMADGTTEVDGVKHIDRGYQSIEEHLAMLGARSERVSL